MAGIFDVLSDDEVRQISALVEKLEKSRFDFLQLDVGGVKLTIGKGDVAPALAVSEAPKASAVSAAPVAAPPVAAPAAAPAAPAEKRLAAPRPDDGTLAITAPMMGRFYAKPEPDAAPFVSVGAQVSAETTVGLIEVMKVFTAVASGRTGIVTEICVQDAEFVEYGQVLFRVRPQA